MRKGYLTVYLSLTLFILSSFVLTLIEGARISATRMTALCAADIGLNSTLSEYNRELLKQYDLLFIDMQYGGESGSIASVNSRLDFYLRKNLDERTPALSRDVLGMKLEEAIIEEYALATDNAAEAVKRQVADYMDTTLEGILISGLDDLTGELLSSHYDYNVDEDRSEAQSQIDSIGLPKKINEKGEEEEVPLNNPADAALASRSGGILGTVLGDTSSISKICIDSSQYVSNRSIQTGDGISEEERAVGRSAGQLTYDEYLFDKCGYYSKLKDESLLKYEIEYIIKNKDSDWDNLEAVCKTICLWREAINYVCLITDSAKYSEAELLASGLAAVVLCPELKEPVTVLIAAAWAYVESLQDIKILLEGGGVPVAKTASNWHTDILDILHPRTALKSYPGQAGPVYGDYLKTMLLMTGYEKVVAKSMDVMEMDVRITPGNANFKMDYCVQSFMADIRTSSSHGHKNEIRRRTGYYYA